MCEDIAGGSELSLGVFILFGIIRRYLLARGRGPCGCQMSASPCTSLFRWQSIVDHIDHAAPRAPWRWTTERPRKGTTRSRGRRNNGCPREEEYEGEAAVTAE